MLVLCDALMRSLNLFKAMFVPLSFCHQYLNGMHVQVLRQLILNGVDMFSFQPMHSRDCSQVHFIHKYTDGGYAIKPQVSTGWFDIKDHINNVENFDRCLLFLFFLDTKKVVVVVLYVKFFPIVSACPLSPVSPFSLLPCHLWWASKGPATRTH